MPSPSVIWKSIALQFDVRRTGCLQLRLPSNPKQCLIHSFCLTARPLAHKNCIDLGGFLRCSVRSASTRKARATTATSASRLVAPYAITPGSAGMSASHRPSSSCSNSTVNDSDSGGCCGGFGTVAISAELHRVGKLTHRGESMIPEKISQSQFLPRRKSLLLFIRRRNPMQYPTSTVTHELVRARNSHRFNTGGVISR